MKHVHAFLPAIDASAECQRIAAFIRARCEAMRREGAVVGLSGGIDSAVTVSLCVRALGRERVLGLLLPERESNPQSEELARELAQGLGIRWERMEITPILEAFGSYRRRDEVVAALFPDYRPGDRLRMRLPPGLLEKDAYNVFALEVVRDGETVYRGRLGNRERDAIVAATDTKQRTRMMCLYYHAERSNRLVCGTTNRSEAVQGFFVKYGDGGVDLEPLAHLYKVQVYQLGAHLGVPEGIMRRPPSPDTFSAPVSDEEFYFRMPYETLDPLLAAWERGVEPAAAGEALGLAAEQVRRAYRDFTGKFRATAHLRRMPETLEEAAP